jgi:hypothetical protein
VASLSNATSVGQLVGQQWSSESWEASVLRQLAPVLVIALLGLVPKILHFTSTLEGFSSKSDALGAVLGAGISKYYYCLVQVLEYCYRTAAASLLLLLLLIPGAKANTRR